MLEYKMRIGLMEQKLAIYIQTLQNGFNCLHANIIRIILFTWHLCGFSQVTISTSWLPIQSLLLDGVTSLFFLSCEVTENHSHS